MFEIASRAIHFIKNLFVHVATNHHFIIQQIEFA